MHHEPQSIIKGKRNIHETEMLRIYSYLKSSERYFLFSYLKLIFWLFINSNLALINLLL